MTYKQFCRIVFDNYSAEKKPPFCLTNDLQLRAWLMEIFGVKRMTVYTWKMSDHLPDRVGQSLCVMFPDVFSPSSAV